jgi:hypothetical protein
VHPEPSRVLQRAGEEKVPVLITLSLQKLVEELITVRILPIW